MKIKRFLLAVFFGVFFTIMLVAFISTTQASMNSRGKVLTTAPSAALTSNVSTVALLTPAVMTATANTYTNTAKKFIAIPAVSGNVKTAELTAPPLVNSNAITMPVNNNSNELQTVKSIAMMNELAAISFDTNAHHQLPIPEVILLQKKPAVVYDVVVIINTTKTVPGT